MLSTFTLCLPNVSEAMLARSVLHDVAPIISRSMRCTPVEPIILRSFSRYAKFDGEEHNTYITRAQELRNADNEAWRKALALRTEYNDDWDTFQKKYFPKPKVMDNSYVNTSHSISYSGGGGSSQSSGNTGSFMAGYVTRDVTRDVTDFIFGSKPKTNTTTNSDSSESTIPPSGNSSDSSGSSSNESAGSCSSAEGSSDWGSDGGGGDSDGDGFFDD